MNYIKIFSFLLLLYATNARAQIIITIAGTGAAGYSGDNGPATAATFNKPVNITTDHAGNILISDADNNCIRKINTNGIITTIAGTGVAGYNGDGIMATAAQLLSPYCAAVDSGGNIYIAEYSRVRKVDLAGIATTIAGTGAIGFSGDEGPATAAQLDGPTSIAFDHSGNIYIEDANNERIRKISPDGIIHTIAGTGHSDYSGDGGPATLAALHGASRLTVDEEGNIYIADTENSRIRKINRLGIISTIAGNGSFGYGGDNGIDTLAELNWPVGITSCCAGVLYFADATNQRVRKIDAAGTITTVAGNGAYAHAGDGGPAVAAELDSPDGVAMDNDGNLLITEFTGNRIRKIIYNDAVPVVANPQPAIKVYPNPATSALYFEFPASGDVTIRLMDLTGKVMSQQTVHNRVTATINLRGYVPGVYVYQVITKDETKTGKVVVEK